MKFKIGDRLSISHPSAQYDYMFQGYVTKKTKGGFYVDIYYKQGFYGSDYVCEEMPTGFMNCMGMEVVGITTRWKRR